jgi:hypothetical protein
MAAARAAKVEKTRRMRPGMMWRTTPEKVAKKMPETAHGVYQRAVSRGETLRTSTMLGSGRETR